MTATEILDPVLSALEADGYEAVISEAPGAVHIRAGAEACAECLIPRSIMEPMLTQLLQDGGVAATLSVTYPDEHKDGGA
jgi:hypothetical protein